MSHFHVRRGGLEFPVAGTEALLRLVHDGALAPTDRVRDPGEGAWYAAGDMEVLKEAFAARAAADEARRAQRSRPRPLGLPVSGEAPLPPVAPPTQQLAPPAAPPPTEAPAFAIPDDLVHREPEVAPAPPPREAPAPELPPPSPSGVLTFPSGGPVSNLAGRLDPLQAQAALEDPATFLRQDREAAQRRRGPPLMRPWLLIGVAFVVATFAFLVVTWVQGTATMRYTSPTGHAPREGGDAAGPTGPVGATGPADTPDPTPREVSANALYDEMELALRDRLMPGCLTISKEDDLDTALRVELSRLGVQVQSIHAPIVSWGGRHGDVPLAVEIRLWYESEPDQLDRELGAIGLVVGKYTQNYSLEVRAFEVFLRDAQGETRARSLDSTAARQFYLRRLSLLEFLTAEAG